MKIRQKNVDRIWLMDFKVAKSLEPQINGLVERGQPDGKEPLKT